jgi:hypothetical protein
MLTMFQTATLAMGWLVLGFAAVVSLGIWLDVFDSEADDASESGKGQGGGDRPQ